MAFSQAVSRALQGGLMVLLGVCLALSIAELSMRVFWRQRVYSDLERTDPPIFQTSSYLPWTLRPGARGMQTSLHQEFHVEITVNSAGTRGPELAADGARQRVLLVGDSFTFGFGVEEQATFARVLEQQLTLTLARGAPPVEVINAGYAAGYAPDTYYAFLTHELQRFAPALVVLVFCGSNDIGDLLMNQWTAVDAHGLPEQIRSPHYTVQAQGKRILLPLGDAPPTRVHQLRSFLATHSQLFVLSMRALSALRHSRPPLDMQCCANWPPLLSALFGKTRLLLQATQRYLRTHNVPFALVVTSAQVQASEEQWRQYQRSLPQCDADRTRPNRDVLTFCQEVGLPCHDLLPAFLQHPEPQGLFFPRDGHWNAAGHALAAEEMAQFLLAQGLLR